MTWEENIRVLQQHFYQFITEYPNTCFSYKIVSFNKSSNNSIKYQAVTIDLDYFNDVLKIKNETDFIKLSKWLHEALSIMVVNHNPYLFYINRTKTKWLFKRAATIQYKSKPFINEIYTMLIFNNEIFIEN